jgi:hypothetical protein
MVAVVLLVGLALRADAVSAQSYAELRGRVTDEQGGVMPGAAIVVRNQESGQFREIVTGADGSYLVTALSPGIYEISAELAGFRRFTRRDVRLAVGEVTTINVRLQLGVLEETVTVSGQSPLVDITSKTVGGNLDNQELVDTPVANRNTMGYMALLPGVVASESTSWGADSVSINGQPFTNTQFALDGGFNNDMWNGGSGGAQVRTPIESVAEFQVQTSQYDAEFGWGTGGVLNAISKQGTNQLRGSAFGFFQHSALTAKEFFTEQFGLEKPDYQQQQWGATLGGPVIRNKAHFFLSLERVAQDRPVTINIETRPEFNKNVLWKDRIWNYLARFDHQINGNHTWTVRWVQELSPQADQLTTTSRTEAMRERENDNDRTLSFSMNSVVGGTRVNTIRVHYVRENVFFGNPGIFETGSQAALPPTLDMLTFLDQQSSRASRRKDDTMGLDDTFAWFVPNKGGDHDIKFGLQYVYAPLQFGDEGNMNGTFQFNTDQPFNPSDPRSYPERLSVRVPGALDFLMKGHFLGLFAQDKWKLNQRATLNLGVRYDLELIPIPERDNPRFSDAGDYPRDTNNISPRVGLSYALDDDGRSVVRGGLGLFYQKTPFGSIDNFISQGVFADSFTVLFPTNGVDTGPSRGQFPTDPFLANGPTVNRALLNQRFPPGTLDRNNGDVWLDNPNRGNAFSRQYTIGYERQLSNDMALTLDYVRSENRDQLIRANLNPPTRISTARTAPVVRPDPNFAQNVWELINVGQYNYNALQLQFNKRFSQGYGYRVSYTLSRTHGNTSNDVGEIATNQVGSDLNLDLGEGPTEDDRTHILSVSGTFQIPGVRGLSINPLVRYMSGPAFTLVSSRQDLNQNGRFDDEYLPAGTYTGSGANAFTTENKGGLNGARGPDFFEVDVRTTYSLPFSAAQRLQVFAEIYNLTNRANFDNPGGDERLSSFLDLRSMRQGNTSRRAQLGLRFAF